MSLKKAGPDTVIRWRIATCAKRSDPFDRGNPQGAASQGGLGAKSTNLHEMYDQHTIGILASGLTAPPLGCRWLPGH